MPEKGIEPPHCCQYRILNPARLPVPPLRRIGSRLYMGRTFRSTSTDLFNDREAPSLRR